MKNDNRFQPEHPVKFWIIGGGRIGRRAATRLSGKHPGADILVLENDPERCSLLEKEGIRALPADGIMFLVESISDGGLSADWIVPAIPIHVAYHWMQSKLENQFDVLPVDVPAIIAGRLPNAIEGGPGRMYASIADFVCPDSCPEPKNFCTVTRRPRPYDLHRHLETLKTDAFTPVVIQSRQLTPGVGGFTPKALQRALDRVRQIKTGILLATACRCHGVIHAFRLRKKAAR